MPTFMNLLRELAKMRVSVVGSLLFFVLQHIFHRLLHQTIRFGHRSLHLPPDADDAVHQSLPSRAQCGRLSCNIPNGVTLRHLIFCTCFLTRKIVETLDTFEEYIIVCNNISNPQLSPSTSFLRVHVLLLLNYQINFCILLSVVSSSNMDKTPNL